MITATDNSWRYLGPPKTASTTLHQLLEAPPMNGVSSGEQHCMEPLEGATIIVSVRDPFYRTLSLWTHRRWDLARELPAGEGKPVKGPVSVQQYPFAAFMRDIDDPDKDLGGFFEWTLCRWLKWVPEPDVIWKVERLGIDVRRTFPQLRSVSMPQLNVTFKRPWTAWNGPPLAGVDGAVEWILNHHRDDFERFGYSKTPAKELLE